MSFIASLFSNFTIADVIDILIVSFIVYRFLLIVQGTRAVQMLVGVAALGALFWLSLTYELYSLHWLLNHFFNYFFVILIIIFQEQIRSALVSFGETKLFGRKGVVYDQDIEEVTNATLALSREKTGALVVFEKNHGLLNYTSTGTRLECRIHSDILYSLFQANSPLHDGAIVINKNRVQAAGCFLPLSKNVEIDRHLGTRHRAALGITEVSDAVVVIVSEETGKINICFDGVFYPAKDEGVLRSELRRLLSEGVIQERERELGVKS